MTVLLVVFFFNDTATTEIYTLSLHDALPICRGNPERALRRHARGGTPALPGGPGHVQRSRRGLLARGRGPGLRVTRARSEEHTSELQSRQYLVCRLLLEKKKAQCTLRHVF